MFSDLVAPHASMLWTGKRNRAGGAPVPGVSASC